MAVLLGLLLAALAGLALLAALLAPPFLWDDLVAFVTMARSALRCRRRFARSPPETLLDVFLLHARRRPRQPLLLFQDELYTYEDVDLRSNRAAWALQRRLGLSPGATVAVFLPNSPTYLWTWLALAKLGCAMACVNTNARGRALRHALEAAGATQVLASPELRVAVEEVLPDLQHSGIHVFYLSPSSPTPGVPALLPDIEAAPADPLPAQHRAGITATSKAMYIYTSGTTGLPKAAVVTELKLMMVASLACMCGLRRDDVVYTTLPLYHSAGLLVGLCGCLNIGATCALRSKFSASQFWADCRRYNVTVIQYVGELMRYLCNTPPPVPPQFFTPFELIKYDVATDKPVRDERGLCIPLGPGETGLLVVKITRHAPFHGYAGDARKTEQKVLRDVLAKGDAFFNSGDLLIMDHQGFLYFQDRVGDTFRWKGENVATTEVEATLAAVGFIQEVNVYGVAVPGCEGRCGMAAVRLKDGATFDGDTLYAFTRDTLPSYAAPRFVRVQDALEITGTFKQSKNNLVREGFDPQLVRDPLFFRDDSRRSYVPLTPDTFAAIQDMRLSL
ncbi:PREDICTED: bile acyl-CoA synthetase [Lepidothrix coronata]|uniref:long-chain-fatty-acid--CoA ligase n=1 Tax=Lepidothrix coronata TaxID=321398 RepID=A0A6J0JAE8_9PASS|nr:PREDICTED: bile acyl-CoA synthetase [Lepidothrix coronata]